MGGAIHEDHERWCAPWSGPTALDFSIASSPSFQNGSEAMPVSPKPSCNLRGDPLILSLGRLERYKGHHRVIRAMSALARRAPGAHLAVVGTGPYEHRSLVQDGQRSELDDLVSKSDVVALLSEYEAHPVAVMEAVALGVPVVVADTSGLSALSRIPLVSTVPLDASPQAIATALCYGRKRKAQPYPSLLSSWDDCVDQLLTTYERTLLCAS